MWALPDINRLNATAKASIVSGEFEKEAEHPETHDCEANYCGGGREEHPAAYAYEYFDIFSDDPKGHIFVCEESSPTEVDGYFECSRCNRIMVENYTWEMYKVEGEDGDECLPCALKAYMEDEENWIPLRDVKRVILTGGRPLFEDGTLNLAGARHLIGVKMPVPDSIQFYDDAEYDSSSGGQISGGDGVEIVHRMIEDGYEKALVILDAAYQFAVSIGFYVERKAS